MHLQYLGPSVEEKLARAMPQNRTLSVPPIRADCQSSPSARTVPPVPLGLLTPRWNMARLVYDPGLQLCGQDNAYALPAS